MSDHIDEIIKEHGDCDIAHLRGLPIDLEEFILSLPKVRAVAEAAYATGRDQQITAYEKDRPDLENRIRREFALEAHRRLLETGFMDSEIVGFEIWLREQAGEND